MPSLQSVWRHRDLLWQMTERDTRSRYRGSAAGLFWSAINPLLMLTVYTFFFSEVFQARWGSAPRADRIDFALILFVGLLLHGFLSESIVRAPQLVVGQPNLVRKVVFPLEVLPLVAVGSALFHFAVGFAIWLVFHIAASGLPPATAWLLPVVLLPLAVMTLGFCWLLASLGVYLRDVTFVMPFVATVLLFASPIFYPLDALREPFHSIVRLSPLTFPVEAARRLLFEGQPPSWSALGIYAVVSLVVAYAGLVWFQGTRKGFADVL
jgi:lipopolysaccharide transport system permease protein